MTHPLSPAVRAALTGTLLATLALSAPAPAPGSETTQGEAARLVAALLGDTPLEEDLRTLTDEIGGRPTGSVANRDAVEWAAERFREAGVGVLRERFTMPELWLERASTARITSRDGGRPVAFAARVAAMPFSTPADGLAAPLLDAGRGEVEAIERLGPAARGAWLLVATDLLEDIEGLFAEYVHFAAVEERAFAAGAAGVVYMGSRPRGTLFRHNASRGPANRHPLLVMARHDAHRARRLLAAGRELTLTATLDLVTGGPYEATNVLGEIRGSEHPEEVVILGAHLDAWGLGTGALDNGCNVAMLIDVARQIRRLGLTPRRTVRFALWNGEEQGLVGSRAYAEAHAAEMDDHVMAASFDIGSGRITGFLTNGRPELVTALERSLVPVAGLGPFEHSTEALTGTDHFDFLLHGVAALVANQAAAGYGPHYHAATDTYEAVDLGQLRLNAAITAAVAWGFANEDTPWERWSRAEIQELIEATALGEQMRAFGMWEAWTAGERGRAE